MLAAATRLLYASIALCFILQKIPALAQDQGDVLCRQAIPYLEQKRYDEASRILWKAASVSPNNAIVQYNLGCAYAGLKRDREAWSAFAKAGQLNPTDVKTQIAIAGAYAQCGDKKNAEQTLIDCQRRLRPDTEEQKKIVLLLANFSEGKAQTSNIVKAINTEPSNVNTWLLLAKNYKDSGKPEEAINSLKTCANRFPRDASVQSALAYYLLDAGHYKEAIAEYEICNKHQLPDPKVYQNIMYCQTKMGDLDGLQRTRKKFVELFPNDKEAKRTGDEIEFYDKDFASIRQREGTANGAASSSGVDNPDFAAFKNIKMPIKIYVHDRLNGRTIWSAQKTGGPEKINYSLMVDRAFDAWSDASRKRLTFMFVDNAAHANVECEWTTEREKLHYSFAGGVTKYGTNASGEPKATIFLLSTCNDSDDFFATSLHEVGHALGLQHSSNPADVMYFSGPTKTDKKAATQLSARDVERIRQLYAG